MCPRPPLRVTVTHRLPRVRALVPLRKDCGRMVVFYTPSGRCPNHERPGSPSRFVGQSQSGAAITSSRRASYTRDDYESVSWHQLGRGCCEGKGRPWRRPHRALQPASAGDGTGTASLSTPRQLSLRACVDASTTTCRWGEGARPCPERSQRNRELSGFVAQSRLVASIWAKTTPRHAPYGRRSTRRFRVLRRDGDRRPCALLPVRRPSNRECHTVRDR
jgi:hypothetical protein